MAIRRVRVSRVGRIPLTEVSGLTTSVDAAGQPILLAVGDAAAVVAWAPVDDLATSWQTESLAGLRGSEVEGRSPQLEAIAADGCGGLLLVQESPNRGEFVDVAAREVVAQIELVMPDVAGAGSGCGSVAVGLADLARSWADEDCSHAEGAVLLADGRLLVIKEKDPSAVIEFGPAGAEPLGFGAQRWLARGAAWQPGAGEIRLVALAAWYPEPDLHDLMPDFSDAAVHRGRLLLLSDQGEAVAVIAGATPGGDLFDGRLTAEHAVRLKGLADKPEGLAVLPDGDLVVACDLRTAKADNLYGVPLLEWAPTD